MANSQSYVYVNEVKPHKDACRVHVKLLHSWMSNTPYGGETLECVFADQRGGKLHASCRRNQMYRLKQDLPVGEWRFIEHFKVVASGGKFRPTPLPYKINFTSDTLIKRSVFEDENPFLNLVSYEDIGTEDQDENVLIDIIGEVIDLGVIQTVQVQQADMKRLTFRLRNTDGRDVACCLWGSYAEQFESTIEDGNGETLICLIRFAKINVYKGDYQITNAFGASIVTLNPTMKEANEFKEKLLQSDLPLAIVDTNSNNKVIKHQKTNWDDVHFRSIAEILEAIEVQSCKIICSIESVDTDWGWFYFGCMVCGKRVNKIRKNGPPNEKPLWGCEKCHTNVTKVEPKYKLHLNVKDDSGSCKLMMLDTVASTIVGCSAVELWDGSYDEIEDPEEIPIPLTSVVGKSFCFGILISSGNLDKGSNTFFVSEVWTGDHIHKVETQSEPVSALETSSSTLSSGEVMMLKNSETTSEGFTTPTIKRKEEDAELNDITSTSKKLCTKTVKLEKTKRD